MLNTGSWDTALITAFEFERPGLIRLCAQITGDVQVAEDLTQETLTIAWRIRQRLIEPKGATAWLRAIARNVCRRWMAAQPNNITYLDDDEPSSVVSDAGLGTTPAHDEQALLLDRALGLLPPSTQTALVLYEIEGWPQAEIATYLGISEAAVAVRLHRGRAALRRLLQTTLRESALAAGLITPTLDGWHTTQIWCPQCGQQRLQGRLDGQRGAFAVQCPTCCTEPELFICRHDDNPLLFQGLTSPKVAYSRAMRWGHRHYRTALAQHPHTTVACWWCGGPTTVQLRLPNETPDIAPSQRGGRGVYVRCTVCDVRTSTTPRALMLHLPEGQQFWRANSRIRMLPERELTFAGQPAILSGFERVDGGARLEMITQRDTYAVLWIDDHA
jgi:RNA polymerase sigma-70 factor (ECF subfamily)